MSKNPEAKDPGQVTSRLDVTELHALLARSTATSVASAKTVAAPPAPAPAEAPRVLEKSAAVLVFPRAMGAPAPALAPARAPALAYAPAPAPAPALAPRPPSTRSVPPSPRRGYVKRRLLALALLAVIVASRPWWWNVGDVRLDVSADAQRATDR